MPAVASTGNPALHRSKTPSLYERHQEQKSKHHSSSKSIGNGKAPSLNRSHTQGSDGAGALRSHRDQKQDASKKPPKFKNKVNLGYLMGDS